jgi:transposase
LKQFLLTLVCSADGGVPLWLKVANGNSHDSEVFAQVLKDFSEQWTQEGVFVMDAAFYTQPNLQQVGSLGWLSRVPLTLKAAQALVQSEVSLLSEVPCDQPDYRMWEVEQTYGEVAQRWVLIESNTEETFSRQRSRFILATNQLDKTLWPAQKLLKEYKAQQTVERGFRFLKDPLFFVSSVFVKKPQRVEALALIMALTLMVYTLAERKLRQALEDQNQTVRDQRKQPTAKPTFRWIMQKFQGIHWINLEGQRQISNLSDERQLIIRLFGPPIERYYYASG